MPIQPPTRRAVLTSCSRAPPSRGFDQREYAAPSASTAIQTPGYGCQCHFHGIPRAEHHHCTFTRSLHSREEWQIVHPVRLPSAERIDHVCAVVGGERDHLRGMSDLVVA